MTRRGKAHKGIVYQYYLHEGELSQRHVPRKSSRARASSDEANTEPPQIEPEVLPRVTDEDTDLFI